MMILNRNSTPAVDDETAQQQNTSRVRRRPSHWKKDTPEDSTKNNTTTTTTATRRRRRRRPVNNKTRCDDDTASTVSASLSSSSSDEENSNNNKQQPSATNKSANKSSTASTKKKSQANNQRRRRTNTANNKNNKKSSPKVIEFPTELTPSEKSQYIALDAEMVGVGPYGQHSRLARITIVNYDGECIYDHHVQVLETVTDYRTHVSGITSEDIAPTPSTTSSTTSSNNDNDDNNNNNNKNGRNPPIPYEQCQSEVASILHDKIVIGHGLKNDFRVLGLHHPWTHTRDTARYEPFMKKVVDNNDDLQQQHNTYHGYNKEYLPKKLKTLAKDKLGLNIQIDGVPHCPMEDATAALELYKKHRVKWECAMQYKIERTREITTSATAVDCC
jgi:RNA exonuclease 4